MKIVVGTLETKRQSVVYARMDMESMITKDALRVVKSSLTQESYRYTTHLDFVYIISTMINVIINTHTPFPCTTEYYTFKCKFQLISYVYS